MDEIRQAELERNQVSLNSTLTPGKSANFLGSLVLNQLEDLPQAKILAPLEGRTAAWAFYFKHGWDDVNVWKSAFVEMVASTLLCYLSGLIDTTITNFGTSAPGALAGVANIFLLTLFIMAVAPASGAHINSLITFSTMITGLTVFSRGLLYLIGQLIGATIAGGILRGCFGPERSVRFNGGGCFRMPGTVTAGQALLVETISSFTLLFLAFGLALDPRQQKLFGPFLGPLTVGSSLGLVSFASSGLAPGYTGASMNPTRCFAFAITRHDFTDQWIWWVGPVCGSGLLAIVYFIAPPYLESSPQISNESKKH